MPGVVIWVRLLRAQNQKETQGSQLSSLRIEVPEGSTLEHVLEQAMLRDRLRDATPGSSAGAAGAAVPVEGNVVLLNGVAVPRGQWSMEAVVDGDVVSILPMLVGG